MQKNLIAEQPENCKRNGSFYKFMKNKATQECQELPSINLPQIKTVKAINKKASKIPFLNLDNLRHMERPKVLSMKHKNQENRVTERKRTTGSTEDVSFFINQCDMLITKKNLMISKQKSTACMRKSNLLPPIMQHANTSPIRTENNCQSKPCSIEPKRKASRMKVQCKVLLAKQNDFPFYGSHLHQCKKSERIKTKESSNPENVQLFDLDISRISEAQEFPNLQFISKESLQQIKIF